jgi:hypothetical protein
LIDVPIGIQGKPPAAQLYDAKVSVSGDKLTGKGQPLGQWVEWIARHSAAHCGYSFDPYPATATHAEFTVTLETGERGDLWIASARPLAKPKAGDGKLVRCMSRRLHDLDSSLVPPSGYVPPGKVTVVVDWTEHQPSKSPW